MNRRKHDFAASLDATPRTRHARPIRAIAAAIAVSLVMLTTGAGETASAQSQFLTNFRESGPAAAKVTIEIYSDYQCPSCAAAFVGGVVPQFVKDYVKTGRVRFVHRDFPLPQHQYARLAARYVNAAGRLGFYDAAVDHMFRTQTVWEKDGSVDAQMARILPPGALQKVRQLVQVDKSLDAMVEADLALGVKDRITQTPSMVVVAKGKRQVLAPIPNYPFLKSYLDDLLK